MLKGCSLLKNNLRGSLVSARKKSLSYFVINFEGRIRSIITMSSSM